MNNSYVEELIASFKTSYKKVFGKYKTVRKTNAGNYEGLNLWLELREHLGRLKLLPEVYFETIFKWCRSQGSKQNAVRSYWFATRKARDIVDMQLRLKNANRPLHCRTSFDEVENLVRTQIKAEARNLIELLKVYSDPVQARLVGINNFSGYFWCVDPYWRNAEIQRRIPPHIAEHVSQLVQWFQQNPRYLEAAIKEFNDFCEQHGKQFNIPAIQLHTRLPVSGVNYYQPGPGGASSSQATS